MRKFLTLSLLMMSIFATFTSVPVLADESLIVPTGKNITVTGNYSNNKTEAQVINKGIITVRDAEFNDNKLLKPNSEKKNYSTIYNMGTISSIIRTTFSRNQTYTQGGAITNISGGYIDKIEGKLNSTIGSDDSFIYNSTTMFQENQSSTGGAISNQKSSRINSIFGVFFDRNTADSSGGAIYNVGTIKDITNSAFVSNGAVSSYGGAIYSNSGLKITNSSFVGNYAGRDGGAIAIMSGDLTLVADGKDVLFMDNLLKSKDLKNDIYFGNAKTRQNLFLYALRETDQIVLDGGITLASSINMYVNRLTTKDNNYGLGEVFINGDVGDTSHRVNLNLYGGTLSLGNYGTQAYGSTEELTLNTLWANKVSLNADTKLKFDILLSNDTSVDESNRVDCDSLVLKSISGTGRFILDETSFHVIESSFLPQNFISSMLLIDTENSKLDISDYIDMKDSLGNSTKILYMYDEDNKPIYKVRLATNGTVIFSNPYYIDEITNPLAYHVNFPRTSDITSSGLDRSSTLTLKKNITINSWEDLPDENKELQARNILIGDSLTIYGGNKTIKVDGVPSLVGMIIDKNERGDAKYLYAEKTTFYYFETTITNKGGIVSLNNVSFDTNGLADEFNNILTKRGGALYNINGNMSVLGTKKGAKSNFFNNKAQEGGAIYNSGILEVDYTTFGKIPTKKASYNNSANYGGAIYNYQNDDSSLLITNSKFVANNAVSGGAVYNSYDKGTILLDNQVVYNDDIYDISSATVVEDYVEGVVLDEGQIVYDGKIYNGAVFVEDYITPVSSSNPARIENSTFTHNKASDMGGAIYNEGNLRVKNTTFGNSSKKTSYANTAENGGAAVANCGNGIFTSTASNYYYSSGYKGGAIFNTDSAITHIEGGTLNNNVATYGGAIFNDVNATLTLDAFDNAETGKWVYISMSKNSAVYGGAIYNQGAIVFDENVYNLSGSYISNTATYDDPNTKIKGQKIIIKDYGQGPNAEANRAKAVADVVSGDVDVLPENLTTDINGNQIGYITPKGGAIYNAGTILKDGQVVYEGKIYDLSENNKVGEYTPSGYLDADGNVIELVGTDLLRDGIVYGMANAVQGDKFIEQTVLGNNQIVLKDETNGQDTVFDNVLYVKDYVEGTQLNDGDIILSDKIWTGADYVKDFVAGTVLEEGQIVFNDYIYNAIDKGDFIEGTVLESGQVIWDNKVYSGLVVDGTYQGTVLQPNEMVYNGKVWSDVQLVGDYQAKTTLAVGQIRWDNPDDVYGDAIYSGAVDKGLFVQGTVLGAGQMNYNGFVYEGYEIKGSFVPSTTLAVGEFRWQDSPNGDAVYTGAVLVGNYVEGTPVLSNQVVYKGNIYDGAVMLSEYREGTPLSEGQIIMGPRGNANIYDGAVLVGDNVDGLTQSELSLVNPNYYLYGNKIYDISDAVDTGVKYIAPIVPLNDDQIVINGFIYDMSDATDTGVKFVAGSVLGEYDKVHAGKIYNIKNLAYVKPYEKGTEITANQKVIGGFIYDFSNAVNKGAYVEGTTLGEHDVVINGRVYDIESLVYVGDYHEGTTLGANQKVIDGKIYDFTSATEGDVYVKPTDINPDTQVVINGIVYNKENAVYVKDYIVGTVLGENEYRIGDKVYQFTEADKVSEYIEPVLPDTENGEVVYEGKIYNITNAENKGEYVEPVLPDTEKGEIVYDGKIYDISEAVNTGVKYEEGTVLQEDEIVYNGYVYSNVENKGDYFEGTQLGAGEIVYDGFVYSNASEVGEYVEGKLNINQASFSKNSATTNITVDDQNRYVSDYGKFYTQDITLSTGKGGAIYNSSPVSLNVLNSTFTSNTAARAGGAICNENAESDIYVQNSDFKSNSAKSVITTVQTHILQKGNTTKKKKVTIKETVGKGGAIYTEGNVFINVADYGYAKLSEFTSNKSAYGGAIYALGKMDIHSSTFTSNVADFDGGAIYCVSNLPLADIPPEYGSPEYYFTKISEFDFSSLTSSNQHDYLYTHGYPINYDVSILNTTFSKNTAKGNGGAIHAHKVKVEGATFTGNKATAVKDNLDSGKGGAIYAQGDIVVNPFAFTAKDDGTIPMAVFKSNTAQNGGAIYAEGTSLIKNAEFTSNKASGGYGGALYAGDDAVIVNSTFSKNSAAYGGAIYIAPNTTSYIINTSITGNTASKAGGGIYLGEDSLLYIMAYANGRDKSVDINITGNKAAGKANDIYMEQGSKIYVCAVGYDYGRATITINNVEGQTGGKATELYCRITNEVYTKVVVKNVKGVTFHDNDDPKLAGDAEVDNGNLGTELDIVAENLVKACSFYLTGSTVNMANNSVGILNTRTLSLKDNTVSNVALDFGLKNATSDKIQAEVVEGTGTLNVSTVNVVTNSKTPVEINVGKDSVVSSISTNKAESAEATYKLKSYYDENGLLRVVAYGQKAKSAAIAAPIAAQIGGYLAQINSYDQAFGNLDTEMLLTREERDAREMMNKYACASGCATVAEDNTINLNSKGLWNRAFATFEKVNLSGGPNVSNVGYGNYFGGDMGKKALSNGWSRQMSAYIGYNGSTQDYDRQCIDQNGGTIGLMETWYKGNFFTALTANVGGNNAQAHTDIGRENMSMLMAGVASKTGYNFEFKNGKFIVQPSLLVSYSFIHTFEHNNGLGHRVSSDPIHAIQVAPGVKFVANLKNGWQPYFGINMRWNIMDKSHFSIPDVTIPTMSVDPYVEYGFGVQKRWGDRFTGYGQAMVRNGGRNGVMLSIGFRWAIGK